MGRSQSLDCAIIDNNNTEPKGKYVRNRKKTRGARATPLQVFETSPEIPSCEPDAKTARTGRPPRGG